MLDAINTRVLSTRKASAQLRKLQSFRYMHGLSEAMRPGDHSKRRATPAFEDALHAQIDRMFISIDVRLSRLAAADDSEALQMMRGLWAAFAVQLKITHDVVREKMSLAESCKWCRTTASENTEMKKCSACRVVSYCSAQCQKA